MKKFTTVLAAAFLSLTASAQWDSLDVASTAHFKGIAFTAPDSGITAGKNPTTTFGEIRYTINGGVSWFTPSYPASLPGFNAVNSPSAQHSWIVGDSGYVLHSQDFGMTWSALTRFTTKNLYDVFFIDDMNGWVTGEDGVLFRTGDSGSTWDTLSSGSVLDLHAVLMLTSTGGWVAGNGGYMAFTSDGGDTWTQSIQPIGGFFQCTDLAYTSDLFTAFAVGRSGQAVYSTNAGATWNEYTTWTGENLGAVQFANDLGGLMCGDNGLVLRTVDGGLSWNLESTGVTGDLYDIAFAGDTTAYICGQNGLVLKSTMDVSSVAATAGAFTVSAFPNPFAGELNVVVELENASPVQLTLTDVSGRTVLAENAGTLSPGKQLLRPDISSLAPGLYFIQVVAGDARMTVPVVKN